MQLLIKVIPKSSRSEIVGWEGEVLSLRVTAAPERGAANRAAIRLLAKEFGVAPSAIAIVSGHGSRTKRVALPESVRERLPQLPD